MTFSTFQVYIPYNNNMYNVYSARFTLKRTTMANLLINMVRNIFHRKNIDDNCTYDQRLRRGQ